jgi:tetratricopeptide (TPR) repeat protein
MQAIPLPPAPANKSETLPVQAGAGSARPFQGVDFALVGVVLLFAFLAASFVETGSDLWRHLATGRALAAGDYHLGQDPFTYSAQDWVNPSWLSDWLLYLLHGLLGGSGLVLLKALLVTTLAWILLQLRRWSGSLGVPVVCTTLALLAMSPRLTLEPVVVSYLFLGLTLWLLWRSGSRASGKETFTSQLKYFAPLLVLFALWANLDDWFLLGPALVTLVWLGERLQPLVATAPVDAGQPPPRLPAWLVPASVAVCLVNPHHYRVFTPPLELSPVLETSGLAQDARFNDLAAPVCRINLNVWPVKVNWQIDLHVWPVRAINLAAWSYLLLLLLGLVSFHLNRRHNSAWRLLVWVAFAALSLWRLRTLPFFAVVAGPITVLELQDFLARRAATRPAAGSGGRRAGGAVLLTASLALLSLAWFGWLQGFYQEVRRPAWGVQADPSLQRVAETVQRWRDEGKLTARDRAFPIHPDVANYLVWFCPGEKVFLDGRLNLSGKSAAEYETVCRELAPGVELAEGEDVLLGDRSIGWQDIFRKQGITYLIHHDPNEHRFLRTMKGLSRDPDLVLLHVDGQALLYGWREARDFAGLAFDANKLAFGLPDEADLAAAPAKGPRDEPRTQPFWMYQGRPALTWESAAATTFLRAFEDRSRQSILGSINRAILFDYFSMVMLPALPVSPLATPSGLLYRSYFRTPRVGPQPALPLLAVRAARRALAANPDDANAYLRLGKAYRLLDTQTAERALSERFAQAGGRTGNQRLAPLAMLRHVQAVSALERAVVLDPDLEEAHQLLADIYEPEFLDASLEHRRQVLRIRRASRPGPGQDAEQFARERERLERAVDRLERRVQDAQNKFLTQPHAVDNPFDQARLALGLGLARQALDDILLPSQAILLGPRGVELQIELTLMLGRARLGREMLEHEEVRKVKDGLGRAFVHLPAYEWLLVCVRAADGDYQDTDGLVLAILRAMDREATRLRKEIQKALSLAVAGEVGARHVASVPAPGADRHDLLLRYIGWESRRELTRLLTQVHALRGLEADLNVVRGVLALEWGEPARAEEALEKTLALSRKGSEAEEECIGRLLAVFYLEHIKAARKAP